MNNFWDSVIALTFYNIFSFISENNKDVVLKFLSCLVILFHLIHWVYIFWGPYPVEPPTNFCTTPVAIIGL